MSYARCLAFEVLYCGTQTDLQMKDYNTLGKNCNGDNVNTVLPVQRGRDVVERKGEAFEFEVPKGVEGCFRKRKHKLHVEAVKMRLWSTFML